MTVRRVKPDLPMAKSIVSASGKDMEFTLTLAVTKASKSTIVRNVYESFRMLGDALLVAKGIKTHSDEKQIEQLIVLKVKSSRPISVLVSLMSLRHNINYQGYEPTDAEVKDALDIAKSLYEKTKKETEKILK